MAETTAKVWLAPPPAPSVLRGMNVVMRPLLASPLGRRLRGIMLLEFTGRRSGRTIKVPVNLHLVDGVPMAFTDARWRHNFAGGAPVVVIHRGLRHHTHGYLVRMTPDAMGETVRKSLDSGGSAARMGIKTSPGHQPTVAELAGLGPALGISVIRFDMNLSDPLQAPPAEGLRSRRRRGHEKGGPSPVC